MNETAEDLAYIRACRERDVALEQADRLGAELVRVGFGMDRALAYGDQTDALLTDARERLARYQDRICELEAELDAALRELAEARDRLSRTGPFEYPSTHGDRS